MWVSSFLETLPKYLGSSYNLQTSSSASTAVGWGVTVHYNLRQLGTLK